jgi:hypothetical protein
VKKVKEEDGWRIRRIKLGRKADFSPILGSDFFLLNAWNPPIFIGYGRGTSCFYWCQILALNLIRKDSNHLFRVAIMA